MKEIKRGQIFYADLSPVIGSEQGGVSPVLIIQNDKGNHFSPTTIVAILTSRTTKADIPTHYWLDSASTGLKVNSLVELEQLRTIDKSRLKQCIGSISAKDQKEIDKRILISLGMGD
ncbi:MAG: type II toxin-antitoxin system PemK/MazF family toxin [Oscillospiraceae bacterium]|nr:type II toxin-antitoxin system PemK/MazF family toxin [Candidatus Equicaccousia limihippi]